MKKYLPLICILFVPPGEAADLTGVLACRDIAHSVERLACFDRETAAFATAPAVEPATASAAPPGTSAAAVERATASAAPPGTPAPGSAVPPAISPGRLAPAPDAQQTFGLSGAVIAAKEEAVGARPPKLERVESRIVALALTGNGRTLYTLENMQIWRQLESDGDILARLGDGVTISRGLLGSYWLQLKNGRGCKVTRVR